MGPLIGTGGTRDLVGHGRSTSKFKPLQHDAAAYPGDPLPPACQGLPGLVHWCAGLGVAAPTLSRQLMLNCVACLCLAGGHAWGCRFMCALEGVHVCLLS